MPHRQVLQPEALRVLLKGGHGVFNLHKGLGATGCCALNGRGEISTDARVCAGVESVERKRKGRSPTSPVTAQTKQTVSGCVSLITVAGLLAERIAVFP